MSEPVRRIIATEVEYEPLSEEERFTEDEQLDQCCEEVSVDECADVGKVSRFISRDQEEWDFDPDALAAEYEQQYGSQFLGVELHAVGPQGDCGVKEERWEGRLNCCDEVEEIAFDWDSSVEVLEPDSSGFVTFTGGKLPALVKIRGNGFSLDGYSLREAWTYNRTFRVYAHEMACGYAPITIDDGCTVAKGGVRSSLGEWFEIYRTLKGAGHPDEIGRGVMECPDTYSGDQIVYPISEAGEKSATGIKGEYKVIQNSDTRYCTYGGSFFIRQTFADQVAACNGATDDADDCSTFNSSHITGSCFSHATNCMECGECVGDASSTPFVTQAPGPHSVSWPYEDGWWGYAYWQVLTGTTFYRWICS